MADIFREVDEELQRERLEQMWKRHGAKLIGVSLLLVIGTALFVMAGNWRLSERERVTGDLAATSMKIEMAKDDNARDLAIKSLAAYAERAPAGPAALARLQAAAARAKAGKTDEAIKIWQSLADDSRAAAELRELARLRIAAATVDSADVATLRASLEPLAAEGATYRASATELLALLDIRDGKPAAARDRLTALAAESGVPESLSTRARLIAESLADTPATPAPKSTDSGLNK